MGSSVGKQDRFVILRAVQDVNDIHDLVFDEIEDQIIAKDAAPDAVMFVARNKRERERISRQAALRGATARIGCPA